VLRLGLSDGVNGFIEVEDGGERLLDGLRFVVRLVDKFVVVTVYIVDEIAIVEVSKLVEWAGQSVAVAAQLITVTMRVV
jgi:hypothetical protein